MMPPKTCEVCKRRILPWEKRLKIKPQGVAGAELWAHRACRDPRAGSTIRPLDPPRSTSPPAAPAGRPA